MPDAILNEFENINQRFLNLLSSFTEEQFNTVPFEGSWTAAQVGDHIAKSQSMITGLICGSTRPSQRDPYQKVETVKQIFLDFTTKMTSPEIILPSVNIQAKAMVINNLTSIAGKVTELVNTVDLSETCTDLALPTLGEMTREEWVYFIIYHTQRHTHQLNTIFQTVVAA